MLYALKEQTLERWMTALGSGILSNDLSGLGTSFVVLLCIRVRIGLDFIPVFHFKGTGQIGYKIYYFDH